LDKTSLQLPSIKEENVAEEVSGTKESTAVIIDDKLTPGAVAATPDSPLTSAEAEDLRDSFALNMAVKKTSRNDFFFDVFFAAPSYLTSGTSLALCVQVRSYK